jgi:hypothetical protein
VSSPPSCRGGTRWHRPTTPGNSGVAAGVFAPVAAGAWS